MAFTNGIPLLLPSATSSSLSSSRPHHCLAAPRACRSAAAACTRSRSPEVHVPWRGGGRGGAAAAAAGSHLGLVRAHSGSSGALLRSSLIACGSLWPGPGTPGWHGRLTVIDAETCGNSAYKVGHGTGPGPGWLTQSWLADNRVNLRLFFAVHLRVFCFCLVPCSGSQGERELMGFRFVHISPAFGAAGVRSRCRAVSFRTNLPVLARSVIEWITCYGNYKHRARNLH